MSNSEIFGRKAVRSVTPITADMCSIIWSKEEPAGSTGPVNSGKIVLGATNINITYQQQVVRRRTLAAPQGSPIAVIYPSQPMGNIQIQRLYADLTKQASTDASTAQTTGIHDIFDLAGWNVCNGTASLKISFDGSSAYEGCATKGPGYRANGAVVTGYNLSAEAEGLTVVDNVTIEFLQLFREAA